MPPRRSAQEQDCSEGGERGLTGGLSDGSPIMDARAKAEYKQRLNELRQDLAEAEQFNDAERAARAQEEMNAIMQHLASAFRLGGRDRKFTSDAERARSAVTKRIKQALQKIGEAMPALGQHFTGRIRTGYFCVYHPDPDQPVAWRL